MSDTTAVILVDHGSRREESNRLLEVMARLYAEASGREIVEPAHMDLASPTIADIEARVSHCLACAAGEADPCEICGDGEVCRFRGA
jgi:sirohydrochlorin ferrochelatase